MPVYQVIFSRIFTVNVQADSRDAAQKAADVTAGDSQELENEWWLNPWSANVGCMTTEGADCGIGEDGKLVHIEDAA